MARLEGTQQTHSLNKAYDLDPIVKRMPSCVTGKQVGNLEVVYTVNDMSSGVSTVDPIVGDRIRLSFDHSEIKIYLPISRARAEPFADQWGK